MNLKSHLVQLQMCVIKGNATSGFVGSQSNDKNNDGIKELSDNKTQRLSRIISKSSKEKID